MTTPTLTGAYIDPMDSTYLVGWSVPAELQDLDSAANILAIASDEILAVRVIDTFEFERMISRKELTRTLADLKAVSPWSYLVILGAYEQGADNKTVRNGKVTNWGWHSIAGALFSIQEAGVPVAFVKDSMAVVPLVEMIAKRNRAAERVQPLRDFMDDPQVSLLMTIPGIGEEKASKLIATFGSVHMALLALADEAYELPKPLGKADRRAARQLLGLGDVQVLELNETSTVLPPAPRFRAILKVWQEQLAFIDAMRKGAETTGLASVEVLNEQYERLFAALQDAQSLTLTDDALAGALAA
jgi:hypothetical protein